MAVRCSCPIYWAKLCSCLIYQAGLRLFSSIISIVKNMNQRDPHKSVKNEILGQAHSRNAQLLLAKLQWAKDDVGFSLHVAPSSFTSAGIQLTDFLSQLGFQRSACSFGGFRECYVRWVNEGFEVTDFGNHLDQAFSSLIEAQEELEKCGFFFDQPEGWGYFSGKQSSGRRLDISMLGDGHTAQELRPLKSSEDDSFIYKFTWMKNNEHDKGWVIHYRPKHPPLSSELFSTLQFLRLNTFKECPEYDFEPCQWRSIAFVSRGNEIWVGNTETAHHWYDAHAEHFSAGLEKLLDANAIIERSGFRFLPIPDPQERNRSDIERQLIRPNPAITRGQEPQQFDIAISFAGTERGYAEKLAMILKEAGISVFYDAFYPEDLWGKNLVEFFDEIYRKRASYCIMFVSKEYKESMWTTHERRSAQARALEEKGKEYILPIRVDNTDVDGMVPTIGYVPLEIGIDKIADLLIKKLQKK